MRHALAILLAIGCGGAPAAPPARPAPTAPPVAAAPPPPAAKPGPALPDGVPDNAAGHQLAWVLDLLARDGKVDRAELEAHFAASFLAAVPDEQLRAGFAQLHGLKVIDAKSDAAGEQLAAHVEVAGHKLQLLLALDADHKISGLLFKSPEIADKPASWDAVEKALHAAAPHVELLGAELVKGACKPLHAIDPKAELAIGSAFKLYVLLALADRIAAGKLAWDTPIEVRDEWKSLPSGRTQNEPAGTKLTVRDLADRMISISDNTATDHLLYTIGRTQVEAALRSAKHAKPALDTPFLSTRELSLFKLGMADDEIERYLEMPEAKRRAYLDKTLAGQHPSLEAAATWKTARRIDRLEWFASSEDLCHTMAALHARADQPKLAPVQEVLALNPGVPMDKETWTYAGFKGGSEPGVIDLSWLLQRKDGRWFVLTLTANANEGDPDVSEDKLVGIAAGALDLLAKDP